MSVVSINSENDNQENTPSGLVTKKIPSVISLKSADNNNGKPPLSSQSKNQIKYMSSLSVKKNSQKYQKVLLEGYRLIKESLKAGVDIECIYITDNLKSKISNKILENNFIRCTKIKSKLEGKIQHLTCIKNIL